MARPTITFSKAATDGDGFAHVVRHGLVGCSVLVRCRIGRKNAEGIVRDATDPFALALGQRGDLSVRYIPWQDIRSIEYA